MGSLKDRKLQRWLAREMTGKRDEWLENWWLTREMFGQRDGQLERWVDIEMTGQRDDWLERWVARDMGAREMGSQRDWKL